MLAPCGRCRRHVQADASSCPFCGTELRDISAPLASAGLLLGLALMGCGDKSAGEEHANETSDSGGTASDSTTSSESSTGWVGVSSDSSADGVDYAATEPNDSSPDDGSASTSRGETSSTTNATDGDTTSTRSSDSTDSTTDSGSGTATGNDGTEPP